MEKILEKSGKSQGILSVRKSGNPDPPGGDPPRGGTPQRGHPPRGGIPPRRPPRRALPPEETPGGDPPPQSMLGDTVNARTVRILLECNLVLDVFRLVSVGHFQDSLLYLHTLVMYFSCEQKYCFDQELLLIMDNGNRTIVTCFGGSKGEGRPLSLQFLSFSYSFWGKSCQIIGLCFKLWGCTPSGKSWIHH